MFFPITHRAVFALVMQDPAICSEFLKFALDGYDLGFDLDSIVMKETRIDVFIKGDGYYSNIEMQNARRRGYDLPKRSKFHQQ